MTRKEIARLGGKTLAARQSNLYFAWLGRRGGRQYMFNVYSRLAREYDVRTSIEWDHSPIFKSWSAEQIERWNQERREQFAESAEKYRLETLGNMVLMDLWTGNNCEPCPVKRRANTDDARWRRWEKAVKEWAA